MDNMTTGLSRYEYGQRAGRAFADDNSTRDGKPLDGGGLRSVQANAMHAVKDEG